MLAKMILSGKLSGACLVSDMDSCSLCSICMNVSPGHTCHSMSIDSLFMTASAFGSQNCEALTESNAVQKTACTLAVSMLPIGSSINIRFFHSSSVTSSAACVLRRALSAVLCPAHCHKDFSQRCSVCLAHVRKKDLTTSDAVATDLLIWTDARMQSRAKKHHFAVLIGKSAKSNFSKRDSWRPSDNEAFCSLVGFQ